MSEIVSVVSATAWRYFLPIFVIVAIIIAIKLFKDVVKTTTTKEEFSLKQVLGPLAISLGSMVGTGAVIGVLGAINKLPNGVQVEAIAVWSIIGLIIMLPLIYAEVITAKVMQMVPGDYISKIIGKNFGKLYIVSLFSLYIFGFDGLQYSGISSAVSIFFDIKFDIVMSNVQLFLLIVLPIFAIVAALILTKKHALFISSVGSLILTAVIAYALLLIVFLITTGDYIAVYSHNLASELSNRTAMVSGLPIGLLLGLQRIIQTSEVGLGSIAMAANEADSKPRVGALAAIIPVFITVAIAILGTSYITSYTAYVNDLTPGSIELLDLATTIIDQTGMIGLYIFLMFMILSGLTTLIGSFYYAETLVNKSDNVNIALYLIVTFVAGTLAIFGFSLVFDLIDLLMFLVVGFNLIAITKFVIVDYKEYRLKK